MSKKKTKRLLIKSREGYDNVINTLKSKYEKYDISSMTWEWWQENIEGSKSYLDVTCTECGCRCTNTIIDSIRRGRTFNCNCLRMNWKSKAGYNKMMKLLEKAQYANLDKSIITKEWWEKNIKSSKSYLDVTCKTCKHKIQNLSINTIQSQINYRCLCNRQGKKRARNLYIKKEGYTFIMKKLQEPDYEKYDTNIMTWEWWKKNIKNNHSCLLVTCKECEYICNKTTIKTLLKGVKFGCFCNGKGQYNTQLGYKRIMNKLKEDKYKNYDTSIMTYVWWQENIKDYKSYLNATCKECGFTSNTTDISRLLGDRSFRCFCKGSVPFKSKEGYEYTMDKLKQPKYENYDTSIMTWGWWQENIEDCSSYLDTTCKICDYHCTNTIVSIISSPSNNGCFGCFCNGGVPFKSREGYDHIMEILKNSKYENYDTSTMTWTWWQENIQDHESYLDCKCKICEYHCQRSSISNIKVGHDFGCFCNGNGRWNTKTGYERIMKILKQPLYDNYDTSIMTWEWWQENIEGSKSYLDVTCTECGCRCNKSIITSISGGEIFGCSCRYKTQTLVQQLWVDYCKDKEYYPNLNCGNISIDGTRMTFDHKAICNENIIIGETDGDRERRKIGVTNWVGHFTEGSTRTNDIKKQKIAFNLNYGLWRLYQPWIWDNKDNLEYLKYILYKMWDKCEAKTLVIMDIHKDLYNFHLNHWKNLGGHIIYVESDEEFTPSAEH
jgi:hypothetical protein